MTFITAALTWVAANQAVLIPVAVLILNDIANGLMAHPSPTANAVVFGIRFIMDWFSVHTNSDSPGTFKIPIVQSSKPPPVVGTTAPPTLKPVGGFVGLQMLLLLFGVAALLSTISCAHMTPVEAELVGCGTSSVSANTVSGALGALTAGSTQATESQLEMLALGVGAHVAWCVITTLVDAAEASLSTQGSGVVAAAYDGDTEVVSAVSRLSNAQLILVTVRGEQYLHGWHLDAGHLKKLKAAK